MEQHLNTLYINTQNAYLRLDHETLIVEVAKQTKLQIPLHHIGSLILFGRVLVSPGLLERCASDGRSITWLRYSGRYVGRLEGPVSGNVLLRKAQWKTTMDESLSLQVARNMIAGKIQNARTSILRSARDAGFETSKRTLSESSKKLANSLSRIAQVKSLAGLRGIEGEAAQTYFSTFNAMLRHDIKAFAFHGRNKRPPKDPINAVLSFLYAILLSDCVAGLQGVGLDPQVGVLHCLRPGRPALGLDLMEEFRPVLADRLAITLVNRCQLNRKDFEFRDGGAVYLSDAGRKKTLIAYQKRKKVTIRHQVLDQQTSLGFAPHIQARLLARTLRGDIARYPPFLMR